MQGLSRDILATKMLELEKQGYEVIMHVHDEVVLEVNENVSIEDIKRKCNLVVDLSKFIFNKIY